jgi:uncharacterized protein YjbI with pentapeptide repeats
MLVACSAPLEGANLAGTDLGDADLNLSRLIHAKFTDANMTAPAEEMSFRTPAAPGRQMP